MLNSMIINLFIPSFILLGIYKQIPEDFHLTLLYFSIGVLAPFLLSRTIKFFKLKKISCIVEYFPLYLGLGIYGYINNEKELLVLSIGFIFKYLLNIAYGSKIVLLNPFERVLVNNNKYSQVIRSFMFFASLLYLVLQYNFTNIPDIVVAVTVIGLSLIFILNIDFFQRLGVLILLTFENQNSKIREIREEEAIKVTLKELSGLWIENEQKIRLKDLAESSWVRLNSDFRELTYTFNKNVNIQYFWLNSIKSNNFSFEFKNAVGEVLTFLEENGDVPSVVQEQKEEKIYKKMGDLNEASTYDVLATQSLTDHCIMICNNILKHADKKKGIVQVEKLVLTALCHDLGKVWGHKNIGAYSTHNHPQSSIQIMEGFSTLEEYQFKKEVFKMVAGHHQAVSKDFQILADFKEYDSKARREYFNLYMKTKKDEIVKEEKSKEFKELKQAVENNMVNLANTKDIPVVKSEELEEKETVENVIAETFKKMETEIEEEVKTDVFTDSVDDITYSNNDKEEEFEELEEPKIEVVHEPIKNESKQQETKSNNLEVISNDAYTRDNGSSSPNALDLSSLFESKEDFIEMICKKGFDSDKNKDKVIAIKGERQKSNGELEDLILCNSEWIKTTINQRYFMLTKENLYNRNASEEDNKEIYQQIINGFRLLANNYGMLNNGWLQKGYYHGRFYIYNKYDYNNDKEPTYSKFWAVPLNSNALDERYSFEELLDKMGDLKNEFYITKVIK